MFKRGRTCKMRGVTASESRTSIDRGASTYEYVTLMWYSHGHDDAAQPQNRQRCSRSTAQSRQKGATPGRGGTSRRQSPPLERRANNASTTTTKMRRPSGTRAATRTLTSSASCQRRPTTSTYPPYRPGSKTRSRRPSRAHSGLSSTQSRAGPNGPVPSVMPCS